MTRRTLEIESLAQLDDHLARIASLAGCYLQGLDLTGRATLAGVEVAGAVFLGCRFDPGADDDLRARGGLIFPALPGVPFDPYRNALYAARELYDTAAYADSLDARSYAWRQGHVPEPGIDDTLAMALHDHSIGDALADALRPYPARDLMGIMGGHAIRRDEPAYREAAELGRELTRAGRLVLTGGGPGAMEAANLGALLAPREDDALTQACAMLAQVPDFRPSIEDWAGAAFAVLDRFGGPDAGASVGIPTWFYGHEPPNVFATMIAKYFSNALREDTLLTRSRGGIACLPGAAGTVQEIFAATTENYYAPDPELIAPMVLIGVEHWTERLPAWPLLAALGRDRPMGAYLHLAPDAAAAGRALLG